MSSAAVPRKMYSESLWDRALERYRDELEANNDYQDILDDGSLDSLLDHAETLKPSLSSERGALISLNRLNPILKFVDDFAAVMALAVGADAKLTALVWGSLRLILTLASSEGDTLKDVVDMLEELSLTLPRFKDYERTLPVDAAFEVALLDVYTEAICFYARTIHFFRNNPHDLLRRNAWPGFRGDFDSTIKRMKRFSAIVESEADIARMRVEKGRYGEVLELIKDLKTTKTEERRAKRFYSIPNEPTVRFWGREEVLTEISRVIDPEPPSTSLRAVTLYGMGGVGKTKAALRYVYNNKEKYDAIFWVPAENAISMGQTFWAVAEILGILPGEDDGEKHEKRDTAAATQKVKTWLIESQCRWLVVFDNLDDFNVVKHVWPGSGQGSILITSRDSNFGHTFSTSSIPIQPFDHNLGAQALLNLAGLDKNSSTNLEHAIAISKVLGGLPLAITQIASFIYQRKMPLKDFLPLYERNTAKIDAKKGISGDSEHTLSTVWELSLNRLEDAPRHLQNILAFLEPDGIDEEVLLQGATSVDDEDFMFLQDELDLGDAEEALLQSALIEKDNQSGVLSVHRLIQSAVIQRLNKEERVRYLDLVVKLLSWGFPDHWKQDQGHQFQTWKNCEKCLPHVNNLVKTTKRYNIKPKDAQSYAELLLKCSWYLYEREVYDIAQGLTEAALNIFTDRTSMAFASATDLLGLILMDMANSTDALVAFEEAFNIREAQLAPDDPFIAFSLNNIALAYTEIPDLPKAYETHTRAIDIRLSLKSDRIGNSYSNMSSLLLRMGKPEEAEEMLKRCPSLKDFTDETFLKTGNPRFSGDMVLLSRIRKAQGRAEEALRLSTKALEFRRSLLGNRFKTCDSLHDVATFLHLLGKSAAAVDVLNELIRIASALPQGEGQLARAYFRLWTIYDALNRPGERDECKINALEARGQFRPEAGDNSFDESQFASLCPWMLW